MADVWRCTQCKKVKDLKGTHLNGKATVRSDCWPCGKKTTFEKVSPTRAPVSATMASTTVSATAGALPVSISVTPSNEAQAAAFHNIFAAATAAAAAATTSAVTVDPPTFAFPALRLDGGKPDGRPDSSGCGAAAPVFFGASRTSSNPPLTPAVSAASVKKFQTSYASVMAAKHEDPTPSTTTSSAVAAMGSTDAASETSKSSTSAFTPSTTSPYVMESSAGTSPPFTFRANANYSPAAAATGSAWPCAAPLPGSTAATNVAGRGPSPPSPSPADAKLLATTADAGLGGSGSASADTSNSTADGVWMCGHCHKVKDLKGDHLRGKTTVRSDCWPCAKKRTFVLTTPGAVALATSGSWSASTTQRVALGGEGSRTSSRPASSAVTVVPPSKSAFTASLAAPGLAALTNPFVAPPQVLDTPPRTTAGATVPSPVDEAASTITTTTAAAAAKPFAWVTPVIPTTATAEDAFLLHRETSLSTAQCTDTVVTVTAAWDVVCASLANDGGVDAATYYAAMARFDQQLLKSFRERLVGGVQLRAVWFDRVLYVIAEDPSADGSAVSGASPTLAGVAKQETSDYVAAFAELGRYAALYLAVEQKLAGSRFRHIRRLFCPSEFAFAAACCYANNFFAAADVARMAPAAAPLQCTTSKFDVYGPQTDPTKSLSLWGRIVSASPVARRCVVSEEQRVVAAQMLYRRVSWLAAPQTMTATAIQLSVEAAESTPDVHGVDVVLLTGTMKLEELPHAVPLAQLSQPYV